MSFEMNQTKKTATRDFVESGTLLYSLIVTALRPVAYDLIQTCDYTHYYTAPPSKGLRSCYKHTETKSSTMIKQANGQ